MTIGKAHVPSVQAVTNVRHRSNIAVIVGLSRMGIDFFLGVALGAAFAYVATILQDAKMLLYRKP